MSEIYSVSEANKIAKVILESNIPYICIQGELSNITYHTSGHLYFTIKDDLASLKGVIFSYLSKGISSSLKHGDLIKIFGRMTIYEMTGQYQIVCSAVESADIKGELYRKFLDLKNKLELEGYFDEKHKKAIPFATSIGVVTSETGAVIRDIITTAKSRFPNINITLFPAKVQGDGYLDIIEGIKFFNESSVDLIIIGRGGGSFEDLNCFNNEQLAYEIFKSSKPIISAVGHETDFVISDFIADVRAATPTQAAVIAVPIKADLIEILKQQKIKLFQVLQSLIKENSEALAISKKEINKYIFDLINRKRLELKNLVNSYVIKNYAENLKQNYLHLDNLMVSLQNTFKIFIEFKRHSFIMVSSILESLSPLKILSRGYSIVTRNDKNASLQKLKKDDIVKILFWNGNAQAKITDIEKN